MGKIMAVVMLFALLSSGRGGGPATVCHYQPFGTDPRTGQPAIVRICRVFGAVTT